MSHKYEKIDVTTVDRVKALGRNAGQEDFLREMVAIYKTEGESYIERIRQGISKQDKGTVYVACHSFKSASSNIGATEVFRVCSDFERVASDKVVDFDYLTKSFESLVDEYVEALDALERML